MDIEYEKIKEIRGNNQEELSEVPKMVDTLQMQEIIRNINGNINDFKIAAANKDLDSSINALTKVLYSILDGFVQEGIYPGSIFDIVLLYKFDRIWMDGKIHYNEFHEIVPPRNWSIPYNDFRKELSLMESGNYQMSENDLEKDYEKVVELYIQSGFPYRNELSLIDEKEANKLSYRLYYMLESYLNSDDSLEVAQRLGEILYTVMCTFVEMGCNPKEYLDSYIEERKGKTR
mgnify:CR=1 FL=1